MTHALLSETPSRKTVLWSSCSAHAVQDGLSAAVYVLLPILSQTLGLSYGQVGLFKGLKSLVQGLLEISSGFATERFGERSLLVFGLALAGLGYLLLSSADNAGLVVFCLVIVGLGGAYQHAPSSALVSRAYASSGRRAALGIYNSSGDAGKLVYTGCFSLAIGAGLSWPMITFGFGLSALLAAVVIFSALKSMTAEEVRHAPDLQKTPSPDPAIGWGIVDRRGFCALLAVVFIDSMVQAGTLTFIAFVMLAKGVPLSLATLAAVALLIGGMGGKAACGFLADRIGVRIAFAVVQALTAIGIIAVLLAPSLGAYILLPFVGIFLQGSTSITYGMVDDLVHADRTPRGYALVYASSSFASVAGPLGFGLIADAHEINTAMAVMAVVAALAIGPSLMLRGRK
jgi:FSR family fosmidomycin resistance protein-like MFS transporter